MSRVLSIRVAARRAFSLQEVLVSVGVLGIGLVLVAAVFPAALTEHRIGVERSAGLTLSRRAEAILNAKIDKTTLWRPVSAGLLAPGEEGPWSALPALNLVPHENVAPPPPLVTGQWFVPAVGLAPPATSSAYGNYINTLNWPVAFPSPAWVNNALTQGAADIVGDLRWPIDDFVAEESAGYRLVWHGFYRERADATTIQFAAAICRQVRGDTFVAQALPADPAVAALPFIYPMADTSLPVRLPLPWRVTVARDATPGMGQFLRQPFTPLTEPAGTVRLSDLLPVGSKFILTGLANGAAPRPPVPGGRVLTVSQVAPPIVATLSGDPNLPPYAIEVLEPISDLPTTASFDIWVFPPAATAAGFGRRSPVQDWVYF